MLCSAPRVCHLRPLPCISIPDRGSKRHGVCPTCRAQLGQVPAVWSNTETAELSPTHKNLSIRSDFQPQGLLPTNSQLPWHLDSLSINQLRPFDTSQKAAADVPQGELETWLHPQLRVREKLLVFPGDPKHDSPLHKSSSKAPPNLEKTPQKTYVTLQLIFTNLR